ncbi:gamma-glutamyltransferase [Haloferacaceae archaeon DSL9]
MNDSQQRSTSRRRSASASRRRFLGCAAGALISVSALQSAAVGTNRAAHADSVCEDDAFDCGRVVTGEDGMVVSVHPAASQIGAQVLEGGGNAADAAVAVQFALTVVQPHSSGIGGGGFMVYYDAEADDVSIVNSRERAPEGATPDMFLDDGEVIPFSERHTHGNAVGVPGTPSGLGLALDRYGTKSLGDLIDPSIHLARDGVEVDAYLADQIADKEWKFNEAARSVFFAGDSPLEAGDTLVQEDLARALETMRDDGIASFYEGNIGEALAETVQEFGGSMTRDDLRRYEATIDEPVVGAYGGYEVYSMPPPSSGGPTVIQILKLLERFDLGTRYGPRSADKYHLLAEAMRLAYADRAEYMGDPEFVDVPVENLLDPDYIAARSALIDRCRANSAVEPGSFEECYAVDPIEAVSADPIGQTTHFTVADADGNVVSYTTTIEQLFGSGIMVPDYGFMLNNELTDFDATPGGANEVRPNKRPLSSMSPTIMFKDGSPYFTVGSPGGPTIITSVAQTILHFVEYGMTPLDALTEPAIYAPQYPSIGWEDGIPEEVRTEVAARGHEWADEPTTYGNVNALLIGEDGYEGAADPARDSSAVGFTRAD